MEANGSDAEGDYGDPALMMSICANPNNDDLNKTIDERLRNFCVAQPMQKLRWTEPG